MRAPRSTSPTRTPGAAAARGAATALACAHSQAAVPPSVLHFERPLPQPECMGIDRVPYLLSNRAPWAPPPRACPPAPSHPRRPYCPSARSRSCPAPCRRPPRTAVPPPSLSSLRSECRCQPSTRFFGPSPLLYCARCYLSRMERVEGGVAKLTHRTRACDAGSWASSP